MVSTVCGDFRRLGDVRLECGGDDTAGGNLAPTPNQPQADLSGPPYSPVWQFSDSVLACHEEACLPISLALRRAPVLRLLTLVVVLSGVVACGRDSDPVTPSGPTRTPPPPPSGFRASGTVVEIQGGPVVDATVIAARCGAPPPEDTILARSLTDANGRFVLTHDSPSPLLSGCMALWIEKDGYVPQSLEGPRDGVTIRLQRLRRVTGRIVEVDGGPLSRVKVTPYAYFTRTATFTDDTGLFALTDVGGYLALEKGGYVQRGVRVPEGQDVDLDVVHMQREIVMSGESILVSRISSADVDHDLSWWGSPEYICSPCKEIKLQTEGHALEIRLQWTGNTQLDLWVASGRCCQKIVRAEARPGESIVTLPVDATANLMYVGVSYPWGSPQPAFPEPVPFELTTVVR
jgi:hypothetical protein